MRSKVERIFCFSVTAYNVASVGIVIYAKEAAWRRKRKKERWEIKVFARNAGISERANSLDH